MRLINVILWITFLSLVANPVLAGNAIEVHSNSSKTIKIPSAIKISKDLVGCKVYETCDDGYFKEAGKMTITSEDNVIVTILKIKRKSKVFNYDVQVEINTPSRGCYIISGKVGYILQDNKWKQDYFMCERIMPKITHQYDKFISTEVTGLRGERQLVIKNKSNVNLLVLGIYKYQYRESKKFALVVPKNDIATLGGLFIGSIEDYEIRYVERF